MAEIHVQTKKQTSSPAWLWLIIGLVVIGAVVYYFVTRNKTTNDTVAPANTTGAVITPTNSKLLAVRPQQGTVMYLY